MPTINKLKQQRNAVRTHIKTKAAKIMQLIETSKDMETLTAAKTRFETMLNDLKHIDNQIIEAWDETDETKLENEITTATKFMEESKDLCERLDALTSRMKNKKTLDSPDGNNMKMPILKLSPFSGDIQTFPDFWNQYKISIHDNKQLSNIEKFSYLRTLVTADANDAIKGMELTTEN